MTDVWWLKKGLKSWEMSHCLETSISMQASFKDSDRFLDLKQNCRDLQIKTLVLTNWLKREQVHYRDYFIYARSKF